MILFISQIKDVNIKIDCIPTFVLFYSPHWCGTF